MEAVDIPNKERLRTRFYVRNLERVTFIFEWQTWAEKLK